MKIGAALVLIAVGAILRFALTTVLSHGVYLHTVGDILMGVGVLGLIIWAVMWGPWTRNRSTYRQTTQPDGSQYTVQSSSHTPDEHWPSDQHPR